MNGVTVQYYLLNILVGSLSGPFVLKTENHSFGLMAFLWPDDSSEMNGVTVQYYLLIILVGSFSGLFVLKMM